MRRLMVTGILLLLVGADVAGAGDPLPSWNEGPVKAGIIAFVDAVTADGTGSYVPPAERIAVFDNDGTLWAEQPIYFQFAFALDRVKVLAPRHPEWKDKEPFKSVLAGDLKGVLASGDKGIVELITATHAGMTTDEFGAIVGEWLAAAKHPKTKHRYAEMVYQPMLELLAYLRSAGFKTFIVSGGGVEFMRAFAERIYGVPPEQVIGSSGKLLLDTKDGPPVIRKLPQVDFVDDGPGKPVGIHTRIGRRPIAAFGNSDGDQQMLEWTAAGVGKRLCLLVHHTDAAREWAYDRQSSVGKLDKALDEATAKGWTVVDMARDWKRVFPYE